MFGSMDFYDAWNGALEDIKQQVTGVGIWTALNVAIPVTFEDGTLVLGFRPQDFELMGHLKSPGTRRIMEDEVGKRLGEKVTVVLLDGITVNDWEAHKRRQAEAERIKREDFERSKQKTAIERSWDDVYEEITQQYNAITNKALPQQRARLLNACIDTVVKAIREKGLDEAGERNLSRCAERVAQYCDIPGVLVAKFILDKYEESQ